MNRGEAVAEWFRPSSARLRQSRPHRGLDLKERLEAELTVRFENRLYTVPVRRLWETA